MYKCFDWLERGDKVSIGFADGDVIGGWLELFLSCDLRLATRASKFRMPVTALGGVYAHEGTSRFIRKLGPSPCAEMFLMAPTYDAADALRLGIVTRIVESASAAEEFCEKVAAVVGRRAAAIRW